jgi:hypothetical protein
MVKRWLAGALLWSGMACAAAAAAVAVAAAAGDEAALVTQVRGAAAVARRQLDLLDALQPGDAIALGAGAQLTVFRPAQHQQVVLAGPGTFIVGADGIARRDGAGSVRVEGRDPAFARVLRRPDQVVAGAVVRGAGEADDIERIAPSRPVIAWRAQAHVGAWRLRLLDESGAAVFDGSATGTETTLPAALRLAPERNYQRELRWQRRDGSVQIDVAPLRTLGAADDADVARLAPPADAPPESRVLFALYLRSLGVRALARQVAPELNQTDIPR